MIRPGRRSFGHGRHEQLFGVSRIAASEYSSQRIGMLALAGYVLLSFAFFLSVPWLLNSWVSRAYLDQSITPERRPSAKTVGLMKRGHGFVGRYLFNAAIFGVCWWGGHMLQRHGFGNLRTSDWTLMDAALLFPELLLILLVFDTQFFWVHWLLHRVPKLYRHVHHEHHKDRYPNVWLTFNQHPLDILFATALPMAWAVVLPVHVVSWVVALVIANYINFGGHCGYEITSKLPGVFTPNGWASMIDPGRKHVGRLVNAVTSHDLHHQLFNYHFSLYFSHWDRLLGTTAPRHDRVYRASLGSEP